MADKTIKLKIKRQPNPDVAAYWEDFEIPYRPNMNVISVLMELALNPTTQDGKARMACSALIDNLEQPVRLEPLSKFPVVRDLAVDRSVLFENLKKVKAWIPIDGTYDLGPGPRQSEEQQSQEYPYSRCISCTCCMEVCPQFNQNTGFVGAATIGQVRLFNTNPTGAMQAPERLRALMGDGGIHECGYAQNCVEICPKDIPLTNAIASVGHAVLKQAFKDFFTQ